jgi:hypothetical protein
VKPLPNSPVHEWDSGLTGKFTLETKGPVGDQFRVGDSLTVVISVRGDGNLSNFRLPEFPVSLDFKTYGDKPKNETVEEAGKLFQKSDFSIAVVPQKVGTLTLPEISFLAFDPQKGDYYRLKSPSLTFPIQPGDQVDSGVSSKESELIQEELGKSEVKIVGRDILPIEPSLDGWGDGWGGRMWDQHRSIWLWASNGIFALVYVAIVSRQRRSMKVDVIQARRRRKTALAVARRRLKRLQKELRKCALAAKMSQFQETLFGVARTFIADALNCPSETMTAHEAILKLKNEGLEKSTATNLLEILEGLEHGQYSSIHIEPDKFQQILARLMELLSQVDKQLKK